PLRRVETLARINALVRRGSSAKPSAVVTLGGVHIDIDKHHATVNGILVELTELEMTLAIYLLRNHGRLLTRQELQDNVWHSNSGFIARAVDTHISRVRGKLGLTSDNGFNLSTVYHRGYRLEHRSESDNDTDVA
ncbi:MAG TPA: response regulator transcription factor, partial [Burkholderiales bacterium]|nr:response regulator transcription factor [Burkholderiales bacterium]